MAQVTGFIGLGIMGRPMAKNLLKAGFPLVVHSRSRGPVDELVQAGAKAATSPRDVAAQCEVVITMLPNSPDVELVALGDRKSTRLNSSHSQISYAVFCLKKKKKENNKPLRP